MKSTTPAGSLAQTVATMAVICFCIILRAVAAEESVWIENRESLVTIVVEAAIQNQEPLSWAVQDLADYLEKMSGVRPVIQSEPDSDSLPVLIRIREAGEDIGIVSELGDAYRLEIGPDRARLTGETPRATAYAIYHLLHDLGVRWYGPRDWNEIVPEKSRIAFKPINQSFAPDYHSRHLWGACRRWLVRNRMGGPAMPQGHGFRRFMQQMEPAGQAPLVERHPEYYPVIDGEVRGVQANLSHPEVLERAITYTRSAFSRNPDSIGITLGPDDSAFRDERPESRALMSGQPDPLLPQFPDTTDLLVWFINQVAEEIAPDYPDKLLGFYVYSNHQTVPKVKPHPMIFPKIAPINFSRYTSIGAANSPTAVLLEEIIREWVELSPRVGYYLYNFNLADLAMPFTRVATFRRDIPNLHRWGLKYATIENWYQGNWHTHIPGNYMIGRLLWDIDSDIDQLLDEFYPAYYGPAAEAMRQYNQILEQAYETTSAYTGNLWSMHRILTPEVRQELETRLRQAEQAVSSQPIYQKRIGPSRIAMRLAEAWFKAHQGLQEFNLTAVAEGNANFTAVFNEGREKYDLGSSRGASFFAPQMKRYWDIFHQPSFESAVKIGQEGVILSQLPDTWKAYFDQTAIGEAMKLASPDFPKTSWIDLKTYSANIDEQGFPLFRGLIWYALDLDIPSFELDNNEQILLWFGGNDSNTRVYIDGQLAGQFTTSNFQPRELVVTPHLQPGGNHHLVVAVDNRPLYELGTGGIMRPVILYQRQLREGEKAAPRPDDFDPADQPLFGGE